jgi:hypothetical protein
MISIFFAIHTTKNKVEIVLKKASLIFYNENSKRKHTKEINNIRGGSKYGKHFIAEIC